MQSYTYLLIDLGCILLPLLASFYPKHAFFKEWPYFFPANIVIAILFLVWDYFFTDMGVWGFNPDYLTGIYILNLPLEEVLFFICIPYACVFTYFALSYLIKKNPLQKRHRHISLGLILILLTVGLFSLDLWYTSVTFITTGLYLLVCYLKRIDLSRVYLSYFAIVPFFLLSNGILTGSFLEDPIVWYNDGENLGKRLFTIPFEDSVYGFLLIVLNIHLYELLKKRNRIVAK